MTTQSVTVRSNPVTLLCAMLAAVVALTVAVVVVVLNGVRLGAIIVAVLALAVFVVVFIDYPMKTHFDAEGLTRVTPARRRRFLWTDVERLGRVGGRPAISPRRSEPRPGGLVATVRGRRKWLCDRPESVVDHEVVVRHARAAGVEVTARRPGPP